MDDLTLRTPTDISDRSRGVALILATVLGVFGGHRFYAGKPVSGVAMILTLGGLGFWWLYDVILIASGSFRDDEEHRLVRWWEPNPLVDPDARTLPQVELLFDAVEQLRSELGDLDERVDFMERVLAQAKETHALQAGTGEH
jgi:hypothetical protein